MPDANSSRQRPSPKQPTPLSALVQAEADAMRRAEGEPSPGAAPPAPRPSASSPAPSGPSTSYAPALSAGALPAEALAPADEAFAVRQVLQVELAHDAELAPERRAAVVRTLVARGYTRLALERAALALSADVELARALRFAKGGRHPLSAADFRRVIEGDPEARGAGGLGDGALSHAAMLAEAQREGLYPVTEHYRPVAVEGEEKPRWIRK